MKLRVLTIGLVAMMVLLAGCGAPGPGANETSPEETDNGVLDDETETDTPMGNETTTDNGTMTGNETTTDNGTTMGNETTTDGDTMGTETTAEAGA